MKRRRLLPILLGCVASITLAIVLWPREREPEYHGIPLSTWLDRCQGGRDLAFRDAILHMGTNALPVLIRAVRYERPRWKKSAVSSKWAQPLLDGRFGVWLLNDKSEMRAMGGFLAFAVLGPHAQPALTELMEMKKNCKDEFTSALLGASIMSITNAAPVGDSDPF